MRLDLSRLDDITGQVRRSTEESLSRLRCDSVELLQLHNPIGPQTVDQLIGVDQVLGEDGVADALEHMREEGLTRLIGISAIGDTAACRRVIASGRFDPAQVYYNILNPSAGQDMPPAWQGRDFRGLIATCKEHGVAVMNIRVLAAGVLATEQRHGREVTMMPEAAIPTEEMRARAVWRRLDERYGTRAQTAIRFALANPDIDCVVVGMAELGHLEEALTAAEMGPLPDDARRAGRPVRERFRARLIAPATGDTTGLNGTGLGEGEPSRRPTASAPSRRSTRRSPDQASERVTLRTDSCMPLCRCGVGRGRCRCAEQAHSQLI